MKPTYARLSKIYGPALYSRDITVEIKEQFTLMCVTSSRFF